MRRRIILVIKKWFQNVYRRVFRSCLEGVFKDCYDLLFGETIQKLAHPDHIGALRDFLCRIQQVDRVEIDAAKQSSFGCIRTRYVELHRQIEYFNPHIRVVIAASKGPFTCIAANVKEQFRLFSKDDF
ncbi:hypothetical protein D3C86_1568800 [compost metagenome]